MSERAVESLPLSKQFVYAVGQLGWSILISVVNVTLVYFYLPPEAAGLPTLITGATFLGVLNAITLIAASGRILDAITDPWIAGMSDRSHHRRGRRMPFMAWGAAPAAIFLVLMFTPPSGSASAVNILWLVVVQALFYVAFTLYATPYFALLPDMGHTPHERLNLATWTSATYAIGVIVGGGFTPILADLLRSSAGLTPVRSYQAAVAVMALLAAACMYVPVLLIDERRYAVAEPTNTPILEALRATFDNRNFRRFVASDFAYFTGFAMIQTGLLYYVTVLLGQGEALAGTLLAVLVIVSFLFYPAVNLLARRLGKKPLIIGAFVWMAAVLGGIPLLGKMPFAPVAQAYLLILGLSVPIAFLGVLPSAVLADIADHEAERTGERREGMFFAARTLMQKFGQTFGVVAFAALTTFGRNPGDDLGVRLSGFVGLTLCLAAAVLFAGYDEKSVTASHDHPSGG
jgi:GPH family glycoside/pentoside/hexuronide:cation symporter